MRKILLLIILLNISFSAGKAGEIGQIFRDDVKAVGGDYQEWFNSFGKMQLKDAALPLGLVLATVGASFADEPVRKYVGQNHTEFQTKLTNISNYGGEPIFFAILPGAVYAVGLAFDDSQIRSAGRVAYESVLLSGIITGTLKTIIGRKRPYNNLGNSTFSSFSLKDKNQSMPSGHSTVVFALATVFAEKTGKVWAYPLFYTLALSTAYARIYKDKHWLSDVVAGAGIGTLTAFALLNAESSRLRRESMSKSLQSEYVPIAAFDFSF